MDEKLTSECTLNVHRQVHSEVSFLILIIPTFPLLVWKDSFIADFLCSAIQMAC